MNIVPLFGAHRRGTRVRIAVPDRPRRDAVLCLLGAMLCALALTAGAADAQSPDASAPPARIGDIYSGFDHQPPQSEVLRRERASGVAPNAQKRSHEAAVMQQLYRQLIGEVPPGHAAENRKETSR